VPISGGMPVPRPLLLALLGLLLLSATFFATRNANKASDSSEPVAQSAVGKPSSKPNSQAEKSEAAAPKPEPAKKQASASANDEPQARPAKRKRTVPRAKVVERAVADGRVVVLAFFQKRSADDAETRAAVASVKRRHLAVVFTDSIDRIGRYGSVVGSLGINQAPAVVIIDADKKARLVEGYVDPETLSQEVSDARR
jgi:cytoskeletal protein RodZ